MRIDDRIDAIGRHPFRAALRVRGRDRAYAVDVICRWIERQSEAGG
jgi:hypothetical protein